MDGFPLELGEKVKAGVALADFNNNGRDDIIIGTDDNQIYLILDNGSGSQLLLEDQFSHPGRGTFTPFVERSLMILLVHIIPTGFCMTKNECGFHTAG